MTATDLGVGTRRVTTSKAINEAIAQEMERDPDVFVLGEDVALLGGVWGETAGLQERFGPERIMDTPISETGFVGAGVGAAIEGLRPIVDLMLVDFMGVCLDQIYNNMAKIHYESGGAVRVPMVIVAGCGGGISDAAQHSQCLWGSFAHLPGMKVVVPSNPYDAKGLLISAIRDDDPVVYLMHKATLGLPWIAKNPRSTGPVPEEPYTVPIGTASVARRGRDVTIVAVAQSVQHALDVADELVPDGIEAEVLDLRSLVPLDRGAILESVGRTRRVVVVDEDYRSYGLTGEVAATIAEHDPTMLAAPFARVAYPDVPPPYARPLEQEALPNRDKIRAAVRRTVGA